MRALFVLLILCCAFPALAQQPTQPPKRTAEEYIKILEAEHRIEGLQVNKVIETLKLKPGQKVADIGSGSGVFTRPLARAVGDQGVVYAVDIDPDLLKYVEKSAARARISNIHPVLANEAAPNLPEPVDLIVIIDTLHHIQNQAVYLKGLHRYLKPGGRIAIIDFSKQWPAGHEQMQYSQEMLAVWMEKAGFKQIEKYDFLDNDFFIVYQ